MTRVVGLFARTAMTAGIVGTLAASMPMAVASPDQFSQATPAPSAPAAASAPAAPTTTSPAAPAQTVPQPAHSGPMMTHGSHSGMRATARTRTQLVEVMIARMRRRLQITPAEQSQFDAVAEVMRANAMAMETLLAERARDSDSSAVASIRWYERLTDAHAAALKTFAPAFATLYAALSETQRKAADAMFLQLSERPFAPKSR